MELAVLESLCRSKKHAGIISYPARLSKGVGLHYMAFRCGKRANCAPQAALRKLSPRKKLKPGSNVERRATAFAGEQTLPTPPQSGCLCNGMCCACSCNCYSGPTPLVDFEWWSSPHKPLPPRAPQHHRHQAVLHATSRPRPTSKKTSAAIPFDTATGLAALSKHGIGVIW